ncbi:MAG: hypothetical protein A2Z97_06495 [Bdellovibrionales bacterium GWB1_52_6]|nr:MAG: hypothetical protein A2Z97_06495 [Bdellovibrionales bacterium GWB1_52_6]OFZ05132.1 MAG: hypothetical protein A2X97_09265 [Bdellovibrionales bacterium GWA1_52_35]HCM38882.1 hypothetical protein [Bdellovibrionales bacterium]
MFKSTLILAGLFCSLALVGAVACSTTGKNQRRLSSVEIPKDLALGVSEFRALVASEKLNRDTCAPLLDQIYQELLNQSSTYFDREIITSRARGLVEDGFLARIELTKKLGWMLAEGPVEEACVDGIRNMLRAIRFAEENVAEFALQPASSPRAFAGGFPSLMVNPAHKDFEFRSGDVLLSRGNAVTSAAIARIGDKDGQFSHLAIIYIDEVTKQRSVVEAHIEVGVEISSYEKYQDDGKLRAAIFRQPDAALAHQAAKMIYERVKKQSSTGRNVPYDFAMNLNDQRELFCSEVPYLGYKLASQGTFDIPLFQTGVRMKNDRFLKNLGVTAERTFAPSDIEVDPRFELVAEWRNFEKTSRARMLDSVLTQMFQWMEDYGYVLSNSPGQVLKKNFAWTLRRFGFFEEKFPLNMKRSAVGTIMALDTVGGVLLEGLVNADRQFQAANGISMSARDMREFLDGFRAADYERHKNWIAYNSKAAQDGSDAILTPPEYPKFHMQFRPKR